MKNSDIFFRARRRLLDLHYEANSGHVGGNLSCLDALLVLHHQVMTADDRFVLSKGHAAGALYVTLWSTGQLTDDALKSFCQDNTLLPGHPSGKGIPGLLFATGSLGHGPSLAAGVALAARLQNGGRHVYCLCSDGEWQEGSCWEALIFAVHHRLDNLTFIIDQNGLQGFGTTREVASVTDLGSRLKIFGADVAVADGHDHKAIREALVPKTPGVPRAVILHTKKGRGLSFEGLVESHYLPLTREQYDEGCARIAREEAGTP